MKSQSLLQKFAFSLVLLLLASAPSFATHLYGGELYYTYMSGSKYKVTMVLYGDCGASSSVFSALYTASPVVQVYNGTSLIRTMNLKVEAGAGTEVTPVCPLSLDSTTCHGGTIPGVRRFSYSDTITLSASSSWRFRSTGSLGSTSAGRSSTITNIFSPGSSLMSLEATLNNSSQQNSNPTFTTIPTPFFCINVNQEYNIGAVDSNTTDSLVYSLVDGLDPSSGTVSYRTGYSATSPLACATGTFSFSTTSGQLTFKPNLAQISLVVYKVTEYRGTTIVGTSMREMNFIVLSTCSNRSPYGKISSVVGGVSVDNTTVNSCKNDTLLTFNINPVDSDGNNINVLVAGLPTGSSLVVTGNNTTSPTCAFTWNTSTVAAGTYYFYITYQDNACPLSSKQTVVYTINILPKPIFTISTVSLKTCTKKNVFDVIPSGAGGPWVLKIFQGTTLVRTHTGLTGSKRDSLDIGTYTFNITNANGCFNELTHIVNPPPTLNIQSVSAINPKCYGTSDGSITLTGNGGLSPLQYRINSGSFSSSGTFIGLATGSYTLQIKDANDCTKDTTIILSNPDSLVVSATATPALCNAFNSGSVTILASGGSGPLTYAKGTTGSFGSSNIFSSLAAGTYIFRVRDTNNCIKSVTKNVIDSIVVVASSIGINNVSCFGGNNGSISVTPTNGLAPYTFAIDASSYSSTSIFNSLTANNYTIHIKDSLGCFLDTLVAITQPTPLNVSLVTSNPSCYAGNNGTITASGSGGKTPYTYAINEGGFSLSSSFTSLTANSYTITIKDSNNCTKDSTLNLTQPSPISISSLLLSIPKCVGSSDGTANITASGGTGILKYSIDGGLYTSTSLFSGISAGTHTISVRDSNNCSKDTTFTLNNPNPIIIQSFSIAIPKCYGSADATTTILASGGAGSFQYRIDGGLYSSSGNFTSLSAGLHTIQIKDANNCIKDTSYNILNPDSISINISVRKNLCNTSKNGLVRIFATGGTGLYTFEKNASGIFRSSNIFDSLAVGSYVFKVKDANNCTKTITVEITDSMRVNTTISVTNVSCFGGNDGIILLAPFIGSSPFSYTLSGGSSTSSPSFGALTAGMYSIQIKDANGCTLDTTASVSQPTKLTLNLTLKSPSCYGYADGSISALGSNGTAPYTYAIDTKAYSSSPIFSGLISKTYTLHIKDAKGCIKDSVVTLSQPEEIVIGVKIQSPLCNGDANGTVLASAIGGTPGYQYSFDASALQSAPLLKNFKAGNYVVKITDANGCVKDSNISIMEPSKLRVGSIVSINPTCENYADGSILINGSGATKPYTYAIESSNYSSKNLFEKLKEGFYLLHIKDSNNCIIDTTVQLVGYPKIILDSSLSIPTLCFGSSDGAIQLFASGGNPPLRYTLEKTYDTSRKASYQDLKSGNYIITVIDTTNCFKDFNVFVRQPDKIVIKTDIVHNDCTDIDTNGKITAIVSGGTAPYTFRWQPNNSVDSFIINLPNGFYTIKVNDAHNCTDSAKAEVTYDNCCTPSIPNAFTPNNDGKNDVFRLIYKGDIVLKELSIYNRYGQQVFSTNDINRGWDGTFNGKEEELGVYYYMLRIICGNLKNKEVFLKGDVTLIR